MPDPSSLRLYLCADPAFCSGPSLGAAVEAAVAGGVTLVQLRDKEAGSRELYHRALELRALTKRLGIPLVINDRLDIALAVEADGVHLGQSDLPLGAARRLAGRRLFIGVSAHTPEEARTAEQEGADYLGTGAVFPTGTKAGTRAIGLEGLRQVCAAVNIPVVGIGGIGPGNAASVIAAGAAGAAVISAILSQAAIEEAARTLRRIVDSGR